MASCCNDTFCCHGPGVQCYACGGVPICLSSGRRLACDEPLWPDVVFSGVMLGLLLLTMCACARRLVAPVLVGHGSRIGSVVASSSGRDAARALACPPGAAAAHVTGTTPAADTTPAAGTTADGKDDRSYANEKDNRSYADEPPAYKDVLAAEKDRCGLSF